MKSTMMFLIALAGASAVYAQNPLSAELKQQYNGAKRDITNAADRMPDADYSFKPAAGNTRTFAQIIGHIADIQLAVCAGAKPCVNCLSRPDPTRNLDLNPTPAQDRLDHRLVVAGAARRIQVDHVKARRTLLDERIHHLERVF